MAFLSTYIGTGTREDPFRPNGGDGKQWSAIDLREDCTKVDGECLLEISNLRKGQLSKSQLDDIIQGRIMPKVQPSMSRGVKEVILGGRLLHSEKVKVHPFEGIDPSDNFSGGDQNPIAGNWSHCAGNAGGIQGQFQIASNLLRKVDNGLAFLYWNAATPANDQWSELTMNNMGDGGPAVRVSPSALTGYFIDMHPSYQKIIKVVAETFSEITASSGAPIAINDVCRCEVEGSTVRFLDNGSLHQSGTDPSSVITSGRWGIWGYDSSARGTLWTAGEIGAGAAAYPWHTYAQMMG